MLPVVCIQLILPSKVSFVSYTVIPDNKWIRDAFMHLSRQALHKFLKIVDLNWLQKKGTQLHIFMIIISIELHINLKFRVILIS